MNNGVGNNGGVASDETSSTFAGASVKLKQNGAMVLRPLVSEGHHCAETLENGVDEVVTFGGNTNAV